MHLELSRRMQSLVREVESTCHFWKLEYSKINVVSHPW